MQYNLYLGDYYFIALSNKKSALQNANAICEALLNFSLLSELNTMQAEACIDGQDNPAFIDKYNIPDYFINLVLEKYNMKIKPFKE